MEQAGNSLEAAFKQEEVVGATSKPFVVMIVGTTGVGKSKLAIDLALKLKGEVISADAMQLYKVS